MLVSGGCGGGGGAQARCLWYCNCRREPRSSYSSECQWRRLIDMGEGIVRGISSTRALRGTVPSDWVLDQSWTKKAHLNPTSLIAGTAWLGRAVTQRGTQARKLRGHVIVVEGHPDLRTLYVCARPSPSRPFMIRKLSHRHLRTPGWDDDVPSSES